MFLEPDETTYILVHWTGKIFGITLNWFFCCSENFHTRIQVTPNYATHLQLRKTRHKSVTLQLNTKKRGRIHPFTFGCRLQSTSSPLHNEERKSSGTHGTSRRHHSVHSRHQVHNYVTDNIILRTTSAVNPTRQQLFSIQPTRRVQLIKRRAVAKASLTRL